MSLSRRRCLALTGAAFGVFGGLTLSLARNLPSEQDLAVILTSPQIQVDARYLPPGAEGEYAQHAVCRCGLPLGIDQVPSLLKQALLAQEDSRFYIHRGIDWIGLGRAFMTIVSGGPIQGGSTLSQQLAKNLVTGNARAGLAGMLRKVREAVIARRIERAMSKDEILAAYLNQMDFGSTDGVAAFGVVQAARKYFHKSVKDLSLYESAMLVGTLQGTSRYNPIANPDAADRQARSVLHKMLQQNRISERMFSYALRQTIPLPNARREEAPVDIGTGYYVAWARAELTEIAAAHPPGGMMKYVIGLDTWHQAEGEATIRDLIARNAGRHVGEGALVAIDSSGRVGALIGGTDFAASQFDRATQAKRQPGSAFKVFTYTAAVRAGLSATSIRRDGPVAIDGWLPDDSDHKYLGWIPLTTAFARSRNTVAALLGSEIGTAAIANVAHELGIASRLHHAPSLALGTSEVTLLELTSAYVPFMNEGRPVRPYAAQIALNAKGKVIYRHDSVPMRAVLDARTFQTMRGMLRAVVTDGTGLQARLRNRWSAGKTGTTQGNRDAWFIGFTDRLATGVWFGNDDDSPMMGVWGADMPALAWRGFNEAIDAQSFPESGVSPAFSSERVARGVAAKPPLPRPAPEARHRRSAAFPQGDPMRIGR